MRMRHWTTSLAIALCGAPLAFAQSLPSTGVRVVPTYEAASLYWSNPGASVTGCPVQYRAVGETSWRDGLDLWFDAAASECRGSLVGLTPGTAYEVQLALPGQAASRGASFTTWANQAPIAKTIAVPAGSATFSITEGGSASGYVV